MLKTTDEDGWVANVLYLLFWTSVPGLPQSVYVCETRRERDPHAHVGDDTTRTASPLWAARR